MRKFILAVMLTAAVSAAASEGDPEVQGTNSASEVSSTNEALAGEQIKWQVISSGGTNGSSTNYKMQGTVGQTASGWVQSVNYKINQGFWQNFESGGSCCNLAGDANNNGVRNILDVTYTIAFLYKGGPQHADCHPQEMNANGSGAVNILDVTYMIAFLYKGGPAPVCGV